MVYYWYLWFYFVMLSILTCVSLGRDEIYTGKGKVLSNYFYLLSVVILIAFAGLRGIHTGVDDWMYRGSFTELTQKINTISLHNIIEQFKYEPLTTFLMYVVSLFTNNPDIFMLCYAALSVFINAYTYKKFSPLFLISIAIYSSHLFINKEMNQIRFGLSSALFVLSVCFYSQGKYKYTLFFQVLAILAHQTAIAGCIIFLLKFIPIKRYLPFILVLISIPLGVIGGKILFGTYFAYLPQNVSNYEGGNLIQT